MADVTECNVVRTAESLNKESVFSFNSIFFFFFFSFFFFDPHASHDGIFFPFF